MEETSTSRGRPAASAAATTLAVHVIELVLPLGRACQCRRIAQVAGHDPDTQRLERLRLLRRAGQHGDVVTPAAEGFGEMAADEPGRAGDQHLHR